MREFRGQTGRSPVFHSTIGTGKWGTSRLSPIYPIIPDRIHCINRGRMIGRINQESDLCLAETVAWCSAKVNLGDPAGSLRTEQLKPPLIILDDRVHGHWNYELHDDPTSYVLDLCESRGKMLRAQGIQTGDGATAMERILLFYPYETLCDGAAHDSSKGYFDRWNIPPWDTWFSYVKLPDGRHVLYSYVPPEFLDLANRGVSVNPEQCLQWLDPR